MERIKFDKEKNKDQFRTLYSGKAFSSLVDSSGNLKLSGHFVVFNVLSTDRGGYVAMIPPNSMVLPDYDVVALFNHDDSHVLGRESNSRLTLGQDEIGYTASIELTDTQFNRDLVTDVAAKNVVGFSFGMYPIETRTENIVLTADMVDPNSGLTALIGKTISVEIYDKWLLDEVTVTGLPAFPQTDIQNFSKNKKEEGTEEYKEELETLELEAQLLGLTID